MTTAAISSISNPARGLMVYDSVKNQLMVNMGSTTIPIWQTIVFNSGWNLTGNRGTGARSKTKACYDYWKRKIECMIRAFAFYRLLAACLFLFP